jgi:predicted nucleic-acid-binding protein
MRILDTVVLLAFVDETDPLYPKATSHVLEISSNHDVFVPSATLLELDLELKAHGVDDKDRSAIHLRFSRLIPDDRILPLTPSVLSPAVALSRRARWRNAYFDTMIVATGLEFGADSAITTDHKFPRLGLKTTF